jgi:hypothetical protein
MIEAPPPDELMVGELATKPLSHRHTLSELSSPGNPDDLAASALATRVSASGRGKSQLDVLDSGNGTGPDAHSDRKSGQRTSERAASVTRKQRGVMPFLQRQGVSNHGPVRA